jgi:hypothetical protein
MRLRIPANIRPVEKRAFRFSHLQVAFPPGFSEGRKLPKAVSTAFGLAAKAKSVKRA